jgi:hypothetical protein
VTDDPVGAVGQVVRVVLGAPAGQAMGALAGAVSISSARVAQPDLGAADWAPTASPCRRRR